VLELLDLPSEQLKLLTADQGAQLHVGSMVSNPGSLKPYLQDAGGRWKNVVGFRPTGVKTDHLLEPCVAQQWTDTSVVTSAVR
jgi:hypothetical protein